MTLTEFQFALHSLYQGDVQYPSQTDDEWAHRLELLKMAISTWNSEHGTLWNELWKQHKDGDGDKTILASTLEYNCSSDFRFPGGFVKTSSPSGLFTRWEIIPPHLAEIKTTGDYCYFTGNKNLGFKLNFIKQPGVGDTIDFPYYKEPLTNEIEMSDPYFAVYFCLSKLHEIAGEGDRSMKAFEESQARLSAMKTLNLMSTWYQENKIPDSNLTYRGFGI